MTNSWMFRARMRGLRALTASLALSAVALAAEPPAAATGTTTPADAVKSWESAERRLVILLDEVPLAARNGIRRALGANRDGQAKARRALRRGDLQQAERVLEFAAVDAEIGFSQARPFAPPETLNLLEDAASKMSVRHGPTIAGLVAAPRVEVTYIGPG